VRRQARRLARRMLTAVGPTFVDYVPVRARRAVLPTPLDRFVVTVLPGPTSVADARRLTVRTLDRWGLAERAADAAMVVSELAGNAFRHGRGPVHLVLRCEPSAYGPAAACTVRDAGRWAGGPIPDRTAIEAASCEEGGRGLYIARELADSLTVRAARYRPGTVVTATFTTRGAA
jgi:anti-sigma regulatory factor (Ser/Thr protein kinase)